MTGAAKCVERSIPANSICAKHLAPYIHPRISSTVPASDAPTRKVVVEIIGGLPIGSTPERPEGMEYSDVPPEEPPNQMRGDGTNEAFS